MNGVPFRPIRVCRKMTPGSALEPDGQGGDGEDRREQHQREGGQRDVGAALDQGVARPQRPAAQPDQRDAPDHLDVRTTVGAVQLEEARDDEDLAVHAHAAADDAHDLRVGSPAEREDDVVDVVLAHGGRQDIEAAEHGERQPPAAVGGLRIDEAERREAVLGVGEHRRREPFADLAGADDDHGVRDLAYAPQPPENGVDDSAECNDEQQADEREKETRAECGRSVAVRGRRPERCAAAHERDEQARRDVLQHGQFEPRPVQIEALTDQYGEDSDDDRCRRCRARREQEPGEKERAHVQQREDEADPPAPPGPDPGRGGGEGRVDRRVLTLRVDRIHRGVQNRSGGRQDLEISRCRRK